LTRKESGKRPAKNTAADVPTPITAAAAWVFAASTELWVDAGVSAAEFTWLTSPPTVLVEVTATPVESFSVVVTTTVLDKVLVLTAVSVEVKLEVRTTVVSTVEVWVFVEVFVKLRVLLEVSVEVIVLVVDAVEVWVDVTVRVLVVVVGAVEVRVAVEVTVLESVDEVVRVLEIEEVEEVVVVLVMVVPRMAVTSGSVDGTVFKLYWPEAATLCTYCITPGENARRAAFVVSSSLPSTPLVKEEYCLGMPPSLWVCWSVAIVVNMSFMLIPLGSVGAPRISEASRNVPRYIPRYGAVPNPTEPSEFFTAVLATAWRLATASASSPLR
jgi:hypothetical protein